MLVLELAIKKQRFTNNARQDSLPIHKCKIILLPLMHRQNKCMARLLPKFGCSLNCISCSRVIFMLVLEPSMHSLFHKKITWQLLFLIGTVQGKFLCSCQCSLAIIFLLGKVLGKFLSIFLSSLAFLFLAWQGAWQVSRQLPLELGKFCMARLYAPAKCAWQIFILHGKLPGKILSLEKFCLATRPGRYKASSFARPSNMP